MANDGDWVEEVKRWYLKGGRASTAMTSDSPPSDYGNDLGYEAAQPALQACNWPDAAPVSTPR